MQVPDGWYAIASSEELKKAPLAVRAFGTNLVLWRSTNGSPILQEDLCPHRSAKLSLGDINRGCIRCPFHGFEFDTAGSCTFVPETGRQAKNLKVTTHAVIEQNGLIWLFKGDDAVKTAPPWFEELDESYAMAQTTHEWPTHITRCVENQLDYAHLPFVHKSTIGHDVDVRGSREVVCQNGRIELFVNLKAPSTPTIQFIFPNLWLLTIVPKRFYQFIAFVPASEGTTRLYLRAYQKFATWPIAKQLLRIILNHMNTVILNQDRRVVLSQEPKLSTTATAEKLFPSDRAIAHFRDLWSKSL